MLFNLLNKSSVCFKTKTKTNTNSSDSSHADLQNSNGNSYLYAKTDGTAHVLSKFKSHIILLMDIRHCPIQSVCLSPNVKLANNVI